MRTKITPKQPTPEQMRARKQASSIRKALNRKITREELEGAWNQAVDELGDEVSLAYHEFEWSLTDEAIAHAREVMAELGIEKDVLFSGDRIAVPYPCPVSYVAANMIAYPKAEPWAKACQPIKDITRNVAKKIIARSSKVAKVTGPDRAKVYDLKQGWKPLPAKKVSAPRKRKSKKSN